MNRNKMVLATAGRIADALAGLMGRPRDDLRADIALGINEDIAALSDDDTKAYLQLLEASSFASAEMLAARQKGLS